MTPQEILDDLTAFGYEDTDTLVKMRVVNFSIQKIANRRPWPWMEKVMSLTFDGTNAAPTNQPSDLRQTLKLMDTSTGKRVRYMPVDEVEDNYGANLTTVATPMYYYFEGTTLKVYPVPPAGSLRFRYVRFHPAVVQSDPESAILVPSWGHEAIVFRAVMRLADIEDDTEVAQRMDPLFEREMVELDEVLAKKAYDQNDHIQVVDDDDWNYDL